MIDAASHTITGIKNTLTILNDKPNVQRIRHPRIFYGLEKFYTSYIEFDAELGYLI